MDENAIVSYLERKGCQYKENSDEFMIRECMFCPKPHYNKADNLYKLYACDDTVTSRYISKKTGAFICHRCGTCGSWFDFKRKQGDLHNDQTEPSTLLHSGPYSNKISSSNSSPNSQTTSTTDMSSSTSSQVYQFAYNAIKEYTTNLREKVYPAVWKSLTDRTPQGRWLTEETLRKYCVGACQKTFIADNGESKTEECVVFPWISLQEDGSPLVHRYKIRSIETKAHMRLEPHGGDWGFFGWHTVPPNCSSLVITEGEYDAMAVYQATGIPAISLPNGATSLPVRLLPLLEPIKEIILWMDFDRTGQENAQRFAKKLGQGRTRIVPPPPPRGYSHENSTGDEEHKEGEAEAEDGEDGMDPTQGVKDACDCLRRGLNLREFIDRAACLPHDQILTFSELRNVSMNE